MAESRTVIKKQTHLRKAPGGGKTPPEFIVPPEAPGGLSRFLNSKALVNRLSRWWRPSALAESLVGCFKGGRQASGEEPMAVHDWTRAEAGIFHSFHSLWIAELNNALTGGWLPRAY